MCQASLDHRGAGAINAPSFPQRNIPAYQVKHIHQSLVQPRAPNLLKNSPALPNITVRWVNGTIK